jgi:hypothetical protein
MTPIEDDLKNIKCRISQQPLVTLGSSWNFSIAEIMESFRLKTTPMEDNLKILNVEYLNNHWSDFIQILNLCEGDQTKVYRSFRLKTTPMEDDLKISNVEYIRNQWSDLIQISKFKLIADKFKVYISLKSKTTSKY